MKMTLEALGLTAGKSLAAQSNQLRQHGVTPEQVASAAGVSTSVRLTAADISKQFSYQSTGAELRALTKPGDQARELGVDRETRSASSRLGDAYRSDVERITFDVRDGGLTFKFEEGPYELGDSGDKLLDFKLSYDPAQFSWPSLARRAFGGRPLQLGMDDIRYVSSGAIGRELLIFLKHPTKPSQRDEDGPLLIVSRDSGQVRIYPALGYGFFRELVRGLAAETQQHLGRQFAGSWSSVAREPAEALAQRMCPKS